MMVRWSGEVQMNVNVMSGERQISIWAWHWWTWNLLNLWLTFLYQTDTLEFALLCSTARKDENKICLKKSKQDSADAEGRRRTIYKPNIMNWRSEEGWNNILVSKARGYPGDCWRILIKKISAVCQATDVDMAGIPTIQNIQTTQRYSLGRDYWTGLIYIQSYSYPNKQIRSVFVSDCLLENEAMESLGICDECNQGMISSLAARQCEYWQRDYLLEVITFCCEWHVSRAYLAQLLSTSMFIFCSFFF